ncbi:MAG: modulated LuxR family transcriptional regulator [Subtercola sp.]|jgi:DNA-binding CsgD family transcriptional regulator|nr:modulated LuxR family transcriptional regulator [Subtercola sp.]
MRPDDEFVDCRTRLGDALHRLGVLGSTTLIRAQAPQQLAEACGFTRAMLSAVHGSRWVPLQLYTRDDLDLHADAFRAYVESDVEIPLANMLAETDMVRHRTAVLVDESLVDRRSFKPIMEVAGSQAYVAAPLVIQGRVMGFMHADRVGQERAVGLDDRRYLENFASELSLLYEAAGWNERITQRSRRASAELRRAATVLEKIGSGASGLSAMPAAPSGATTDTPDAGSAGGNSMFMTPREWEVLEHVADGATNRVIAQRMSLSEDTVKTHMRGVLHKLQVTSRGAAVAKYMQLSHDAHERL